MDDELNKKLTDLSLKLDEVNKTVTKLKSYFFWTFIITIAVFVLPLLVLAFFIPSYLNTLNSVLNF